MAESRLFEITSMKRSVALTLVLLIASCERQDAGDVGPPDSEELEQEYAVLEPLSQVEEYPDDNDFSGTWVWADDALTCDGFLTRRGDEDFCEAEIPEDWRPFEFNGQTYYRQPLGGDNDQSVVVR